MIVLGMNVCFVCAYGRAAPLVQFEFALIPRSVAKGSSTVSIAILLSLSG